MLDAYFIACYSLFACGWLCSLSVRRQVFTEASGIYGCGGYFAPGWFIFQWLGLILLFLFLGMCWLGLHAHSDNSAVGAMLSG